MQRIRLSDAITDLRLELMNTLERGAAEKVRFDVGVIELELEIEATIEGSAKAETKWWVVSAGAEGKVARGATHRLKLNLTPRFQDGNLRIAADSGGGLNDQ